MAVRRTTDPSRRTWSILFFVLAILVATAVAPVQAADPTPTPDASALAKKLDDLRDRAAEQRSKIKLLSARQAALADQLDTLSKSLDDLERQVADAHAQADTIRGRIAGLEASIAASEVRQGEYETTVGELSRTLYEATQESGLDRLLSGDLLGFFTQVAYVDRLTAQLRSRIDALEAERADQRRTVVELATHRDELDAAEELAAARQAELGKQADSIEQLLDQLAEAEVAVRKEYTKTQVAIGDTSLSLDLARREAAALAAKENAGASAPPPPGATPEPTSAPTPEPTPAPTPTPAGQTPDPNATPTPTPGPTATPVPQPSSPPGTITFYGRGTDHGVGLSQWGAYGRAKDGQTHQQILAHYYSSTTLAPLSGTPTIRVLVADAITPTADRPAKVYGWYGQWSISGLGGPYPAGAYVTMTPSGSSWHAVVRDGTGATIDDLTASDVTLVGATSAVRFQVWFKPSYYDTFRGKIRLIASGGAVSAVNTVPLEEYLYGVVPAEVSASWPAAALRAQAVAARAYGYVHRRSSTYTYDVHDDSRSQVYLGALYEKSATTTAVNDTQNVVVMYGSSVANTLFHSAAGGWTENNENVFVSNTGAKTAGPLAYLRGVSDRRADGSSYDSASSKATWYTAAYTLDQLSAIFAHDSLTNVGTIKSLSLSNRGVSGRLISVTLTGTSATKTVSGPYFKYVFNVYSPVTDPAIWSTLFDTKPIP
jgi:SpoIID/LytB domain protein